MTQLNIQDFVPSPSQRTPSGVGSSRGFSNSESDAERRIADSSAVVFSMAMTGLNTSLEREVFLSRSFDRREDPKPEKGLLEVFGDAPVKGEFGVAFLLGPKGNRERRLRKAGIPEPAGLVGMLDGPGEYPIPCGVLDSDRLLDELEDENMPPFFD